VSRVNLFGPDSNRISSWSAGVECCYGISSKNKAVSRRERQIVPLSSTFVHIVPDKQIRTISVQEDRGMRTLDRGLDLR